MNKTTSVRMTYHFRKELRSKCVTLDEVAGRIASGYYQRRVNAVRLLDEVPTELGMNSGTIAAEGLPSIYPAWGLEGYTGLVLISFRIAEGQEILERLRRQVNLWQQTLMPFYIDRIDFANKKEALRAMSRFLLINIDEYDQIGKAQTAFLKHLIQRTDVKERKLYSSTFEQQQRYAAFCATTNSLVPLKDESGSRRYLVVEVNDVIDIDTQGDKQIDYRQLYAQIVEEIRHGCDYAFTGERERQIITNNADYYETPNVISLFEDHFSKPGAGDEVSLMSPTEILKALHSDPGNHSNATILGSYLRRKNYLRGEGKERRRYKLKPSCTETR